MIPKEIIMIRTLTKLKSKNHVWNWKKNQLKEGWKTK
jgi:hypothetical protein